MSYSSSSSASAAATSLFWFCTAAPWACRLAARDRQPRWYLHNKHTLQRFLWFNFQLQQGHTATKCVCHIPTPPRAQLSSYLVAALKERDKYPILLPPDPIVYFPRWEEPDYSNGSFSLSLPFLFRYNLFSTANNKERPNSHAPKVSPKTKKRKKKLIKSAY